jgi:hypothetical protein
MTIIAIDPGLSGGAAILTERGDLIDVFDLPTIGEGAQRRIDAAGLADLIPNMALHFRNRRAGRRAPWTGRLVNVPIRAGLRDDTWRHRGADDPRLPRVAGEVERGARPQQRRRNVTRSRDRDLAGTGRAFCPQARSQSRRGGLAGAIRAEGGRMRWREADLNQARQARLGIASGGVRTADPTNEVF